MVDEMSISQLWGRGGAAADLRNVVVMFGQAPRVDEDIIDVYQDEAMEVLPEHLVLEVLKYGGGVD